MNKLDNIDLESLVDTETEEKTQGESWKNVLKSPTLILNISINSFGWWVVRCIYVLLDELTLLYTDSSLGSYNTTRWS